MNRMLLIRWTPSLIFLTLLATLPLWARDRAPWRRPSSIDRRLAIRLDSNRRDRSDLLYRLPAEFEPQKSVLLAGSSLLGDFPALFVDLVSALRAEVAVYLLVNDEEEQEAAELVLKKRGISMKGVTFLTVRHDSPWVRDYGPFVVRDSVGSPVLVDARYNAPGRDADEKSPFGLARVLGLPLERTDFSIEGGNLLTNGKGLILTTTRLLDVNREYGVTEGELRAELRRVYGAIDVILLEPLIGESTGHADTFATFVSPDTVVLASCDPERDPLNAEVLDRNAERLRWIRVAGVPLRILRIPTPHHEDGIWRTYTNVLYANRVVLVPTYPGIDPAGRRCALDTFRACFPERRIVEIDAGEVALWEGALHCLSMNLGPAALPSLDNITGEYRLNTRLSEK